MINKNAKNSFKNKEELENMIIETDLGDKTEKNLIKNEEELENMIIENELNDKNEKISIKNEEEIEYNEASDVIRSIYIELSDYLKSSHIKY